MSLLRPHSLQLLPLLASCWLAACAPLPQRAGVPTRWVPSPNFDERRPPFVVLHHTGDDSAAGALRTLTRRESQVSAHYLVGRDGVITQLVDERLRAWHAGESRWGAVADLNSASIGVELDNNGAEPYADAQIGALLGLLADLRNRYGIPAANVLAHADVAPRRKVDPGPLFPWARLAAAGFGLWCEAPFEPAPAGFDPWLGLRAIGYDISRPEAALAAFRLRHAPDSVDESPTDRDVAHIHCLLQRAIRLRATEETPAWRQRGGGADIP
jgi:N-acetylmuramoyl-L-alanine amidase